MGRLVLLCLVVGCYHGPGENLSCKIACAGGCPSGMACSNGLCAAGGETCSAPADASIDAAFPTCIAQVALGRFHSCTLHRDGTVWCAGRNGAGQLGDGTTTDSAIPVEARDAAGPIADASAIDAGNHHTCAIRTGGSVWCWGEGSYGQLGAGNFNESHVAVQVLDTTLQPIAGMTSVTATLIDTCAIDHVGQVWCWGYNNNGELGDGTFTGRATARLVTTAAGTLTGIVAMGSGRDSSCALDNAQRVWCWGYNAHAELGDGTRNSSPYALAIGSGTALAVGEWHGLALQSDGSVTSWGYGWGNRLGETTGADRATPMPVQGAADGSPLTGVTALAAGGESCALMTDTTVRCWGNNPHGQVGTVGTFFPAPVLEAEDVPLSGIDRIVAKNAHVCAHRANGGEILCWGRNSEGELDPSLQNHATATRLAVSCAAPP